MTGSRSISLPESIIFPLRNSVQLSVDRDRHCSKKKKIPVEGKQSVQFDIIDIRKYKRFGKRFFIEPLEVVNGEES
jgi:hypothetical protein